MQIGMAWNIKTRKATAALIAVVVVLVASGGCAPHYHDYSSFIVEPRPIVTATEYRVAPPDVIAIQSKRVRELAGQTQPLRTDGKVTLPLFGDVYVAGMTTDEMNVKFTELASEYYEDADVSVRIVGFASKKIFVFGEVGAPGVYSYNGANTVLDTMARAQPTRLADPGRIQILRPNAEGELIRRMTIDMDKMVKEGDTALDAVLEEGDIIYVPPNAFAAVGLAFQQLLLPLQPAASTVQGPPSIDEASRSQTYGGNGGTNTNQN
jgi:polysaccharide export outer membrane protein